MKVIHVELWSIWLYGCLLICVSFYSTFKLPLIKDQIFSINPSFNHKRGVSSDVGGGGVVKVTIFTAPNPFIGSVGDKQGVAVRSWLGLSADVSVVLFSRHDSAVSFASRFGSRVLVEPDIDFAFTGTPFFHSMVARATASASDIFVMIDPETILLPDFILTLNYAHKLESDWLIFASSRNVSNFPFQLDEAGKRWIGGDGKGMKKQKLQDILAQSWPPNCSEQRMLLAWNNGDLPLHNGVLPPFLYRKGIYDHWVINEVIRSDFRFVFDASWVISSFYQDDPTNIEISRIPDNGDTGWEYAANAHLGAIYGSILFHEANYSSIVKLSKCNGKYHFVDPTENSVHRFDSHSSHKLSSFHGRKDKKTMACLNAFKAQEKSVNCSVKKQLKPSMQIELPFSLESLLSVIADKNKTIVLAVAGYSYKEMLMSWVCRMRHLEISNFVVCALDNDMYQFSLLQGLPVYRDALAPKNISFDDCHFGTNCFRKVTKVKSRLVLQILKLGYNVLLSDVDVYWFKNPLQMLYSFGPAVLAGQSDEYDTTGPINLPHKLNSGFYFARSDNSTVAAMEKVVKHAATFLDLSEQPSLYVTLCGEGGSYRVGDNGCLEPETNLTVHFLDRDLFPNGAYLGLWEKNNVKAACESKGCYILHNNWIPGRRKKLERQYFSGLWEYDINTRMCMQSWQNRKTLQS